MNVVLWMLKRFQTHFGNTSASKFSIAAIISPLNFSPIHHNNNSGNSILYAFIIIIIIITLSLRWIQDSSDELFLAMFYGIILIIEMVDKSSSNAIFAEIQNVSFNNFLEFIILFQNYSIHCFNSNRNYRKQYKLSILPAIN